MKGDREFVIGDIVKVENPGQTYSTHRKAAIKLGADYNPTEASLDSMPTDKWQYGGVPTKHDLVVIRNIKDVEWRERMLLIERISDCRQFIIHEMGVKLQHQADFLKQELFEI